MITDPYSAGVASGCAFARKAAAGFEMFTAEYRPYGRQGRIDWLSGFSDGIKQVASAGDDGSPGPRTVLRSVDCESQPMTGEPR